jgi:AraC-like DNA-binding protein
MIAKDTLPSPELSAYIEKYRIRHFIFNKDVVPPVKPFPPRPEQCLSFYIRGSETVKYLREGFEIKKPRSVISGQFTSRVDRIVSIPEVLMIIVDFKPGALSRLTGLPFKELANRDIDAEAVLGQQIRIVNDRLGSSANYEEMINIIESYFIYLAGLQKKEITAVDHILQIIKTNPDCSIDWVAKNSYLSVRQLERKFDDRIGISPKTFLRISRFNRSYWLHLKHPNLLWFDIAMMCGYTDYQHMAKEYKEFAIASPNHFFYEESKAPGRILGLSKY